MAKSAQAFRTIREVADWLGVAAHVLRFWESKFHQIKPVKRAGGRRYYSPADMALVGGIKVLLHDRGLTIRGVQKMISDEGTDAIAALSPLIDDLTGDADVIELAPGDAWDADTEAETTTAPDSPEHVDTPTEEMANDDRPPDSGSVQEPQPATDESALGTAPTPAATADPDATDSVMEQEKRGADPAAPAPDDTQPDESADRASGALDADVTPDQPEPEDSPADPVATRLVDRPVSDPMEGPLGILAALAKLPPDARAVHATQINALASLQKRMSTPLDQL